MTSADALDKVVMVACIDWWNLLVDETMILESLGGWSFKTTWRLECVASSVDEVDDECRGGGCKE